MSTQFRAKVGTQRISSSLDPSQASYTRSIRTQMQAIEKEVNRLCNVFEAVTPEVLMDVLTPTFAKALLYTPLLTGALRGSGYLVTSISGNKVKAEIGFGKGGYPFYAAYVHEMTDIKHTAPTRAKFLESAVMEDMGQIGPRLRKAFKNRVGFK